MGMFDPIYVTEVLNDILGRRGLHIVLTPKDPDQHPAEKTGPQEQKANAG